MRRSAISFCIPSHALGRLIAKHPLSTGQESGPMQCRDDHIVMLRRMIARSQRLDCHGVRPKIRTSP